MPLPWPPREAASLAGFPSEPLRGRTIHRVWRHHTADGTPREDPWWFASVPDDSNDGGRYDLPAPMGACYTATRPVGALLEALQAGADRPRTQAWAAAFRRDGWWAVYGGIQHDPSGQLRGHTLFDHHGAHPPTFGANWPVAASSLHDDPAVLDELDRYGIHVREPGDLPFVDPPH